jgi:hypothetical protein
MSKALGIALRRSGVICDHADHDRARTEGRKHAGRVNIGNIAATEDAARRRFTAAATPTFSHVQPPAATRLAGVVNRPSRNEFHMLDKKTANANIRLGLMLAIAVGLLFIGTIVIGLVVVNV